MKHSTPWKGMDKKEAQDHKLLEISALLEDYLEHHPHLELVKINTYLNHIHLNHSNKTIQIK